MSTQLANWTARHAVWNGRLLRHDIRKSHSGFRHWIRNSSVIRVCRTSTKSPRLFSYASGWSRCSTSRPPFLTSNARSSQPWSMTQPDGSSRGCSCRTVASAFPKTRARPAPSSGSASTSPTWSRPDLCASRESILVCLTNLFTRYPPMPPKLNRKRALLVLTKIDDILAWEKQKEAERDTRFVDLGRYLCEVRAGQYWRLENLSSFDEFLARRFPESRRKAYYLMSIHEHLPPQARRELKEVGWTKGLELAKVARRDRQDFDCAT